jgi:hypothetical protein
VVRFETLCAAPRETLETVFAHCLLLDTERIIERYTQSIRYPSYYSRGFSSEELSVIREETASTGKLWGY